MKYRSGRLSIYLKNFLSEKSNKIVCKRGLHAQKSYLGVDEEMLYSVSIFGRAWEISGCQFPCQLSLSTLTSQEHHNVNLFFPGLQTTLAL